MVDHGVVRICRKLLEDAKISDKRSTGTVTLSRHFLEQLSTIPNTKLEAPAVVQPSGDVSIAESVGRLGRNQTAFDSLKGHLEAYDLSDAKVPHPYIGPMTATEWLVLAGGHELRHEGQILRMLEKIRQKDPGQKEGDPTGVSTSN